MKSYKHIVTFEAGFDCKKFQCHWDSPNCSPNSGGFHGVHGLEIRFICIGQDGAVHFLLSTGWLPQAVEPSPVGVRALERNRMGGISVLPMDLGYHSKTPQYDGQKICQKHCQYLNGRSCYYDGSSLNANDAFYALVNGGEKGIWKFLDEYYESVFRGKAYPQPCEYCKPLRPQEKK